MSDAIRNTFNKISADYDLQRRKFIPCFDDFYEISTSILDIDEANPRVLDIGAGTGLLSSYVLKRFPDALLTLVDISEGMLEIAKSRFIDHPNVSFITGDYTKHTFDGKFNIIISALSIHHLPNEAKECLYNQCYMLLEEQGIFVNAEQILGNTPVLDSLYKREWKRFIESTDLPKDEIKAGYERMKLDKEAPLDTQLNWLRQAGFKDVHCAYKYYNFAVMSGRK